MSTIDHSGPIRRQRRIALCLVLAGVAAGATLAGSAAQAAPDQAAVSRPTDKAPAASTTGAKPANLGSYTVVRTDSSVPANGFSSATATCPAGSVVLGGGESNGDFTGGVLLTDSLPSGNNAWVAWVRNNESGAVTFHVYAICGS
jgi:hypothetical protein